MQLFSSIFTTTNTSITLTQILMTFATSLGLGVLLAADYKHRTQYTKEFVITLALLPTLIAIIIFLVNGNLGTSVAVAGAFSLIRFRSATGSSKEILAVFLATAIGLATGMGYLYLAIAFTVVISIILLVFEYSKFAQENENIRHIILTVDKSFDYTNFFEETFGKSCRRAELLSIHYKQKKEQLVLEFQLDLSKRLSDKDLADGVLAAQPIDLVINHKIPKKKRL